MTTVFFQSIGKSAYAIIASVVREIICFTPTTIILSIYLENINSGEGINGILYASPIADIVAGIVIIIITVIFFKKFTKKEKLIKPINL